MVRRGLRLWWGAALVALLLFSGCCTKRKTVERTEAIEIEQLSKRQSVAIETDQRQTLAQRTWVWSVMERDSTGELVEVRRETVIETADTTTTQKIENKTQNTDSAAFSQKSEVSYKETTETPANRMKSGWRWFLAGLIAANVAFILFLLMIYKRRDLWKTISQFLKRWLR